MLPSQHAGTTPRAALRHTLTHLVVPLFLATGMALAYLGGFHQPEPHDVKVDVVGSDPATLVLAQKLQDGLGERVDIRTVGDEAQARDQLASQDITAAYVPDAKAPRLLLASAASDTTALAAEKMLAPVALGQGLPLHVEDVVPTDDTDPTGQGIFFFLVALTVGSYSAAIAIGAAGAGLAMRWRAAVAVVAGGLVSLLATVVAGPVYHALPNHVLEIGLLSWLYASAVVLIGVGLHPFLGRFTTAALVTLFVMLNFTSSGGVFAPSMQPPFFASLHGFWIGSGLVEAGRTLLYFPGVGIGRELTVLVCWLLAGVAVVLAAAARERARRTPVVADEVEEEIEEAVAA